MRQQHPIVIAGPGSATGLDTTPNAQHPWKSWIPAATGELVFVEMPGQGTIDPAADPISALTLVILHAMQEPGNRANLESDEVVGLPLPGWINDHGPHAHAEVIEGFERAGWVLGTTPTEILVYP